MGGFFGVASKSDCVFDLFFGTDYHSHLGTRRGGMAVFGESGFQRAIHNIENAPFRTKFERDIEEMAGNLGIGCISDNEPQPLLPVVVNLSYEANRLVGRYDNWLTKALRAPGLALQLLTTKEPDDEMIKVAIDALERVIPAEKGADQW